MVEDNEDVTHCAVRLTIQTVKTICCLNFYRSVFQEGLATVIRIQRCLCEYGVKALTMLAISTQRREIIAHILSMCWECNRLI